MKLSHLRVVLITLLSLSSSGCLFQQKEAEVIISYPRQLIIKSDPSRASDASVQSVDPVSIITAGVSAYSAYKKYNKNVVDKDVISYRIIIYRSKTQKEILVNGKNILEVKYKEKGEVRDEAQ